MSDEAYFYTGWAFGITLADTLEPQSSGGFAGGRAYRLADTLLAVTQ